MSPHAGFSTRTEASASANSPALRGRWKWSSNCGEYIGHSRLTQSPATSNWLPVRIIGACMAFSFSPQRVACLQPSATLTMRDIGLLDRVVACTKYCADVCPEISAGASMIVSDSWTAQAEEI